MKFVQAISNANSLDELFAIMAGAQAVGINLENEGVDMTSLPTFGGAEPHDTTEIWSWDETRLIVGTGELRIMDRPSLKNRDVVIDFHVTPTPNAGSDLFAVYGLRLTADLRKTVHEVLSECGCTKVHLGDRHVWTAPKGMKGHIVVPEMLESRGLTVQTITTWCEADNADSPEFLERLAATTHLGDAAPAVISFTKDGPRSWSLAERFSL